MSRFEPQSHASRSEASELLFKVLVAPWTDKTKSDPNPVAISPAQSEFLVQPSGGPGVARSTTKSHFVGAVLEDAVLPIDKHGTVVLVKGFGPVLLYQIAARDTRILIDVKMPLPADLKQHILTNILPQLPAAVHLPLKNAMDKERLRKMPNSFLPPVEQGAHTKEGVILLGDAWNMRHPLTGGGMTVALSDVVLLSALLSGAKDLGDWHEVSELLHTWHWKRKPLSSTINILSVALYDLFGADDEYLAVLRRGCFKYFERGGDCVEGPVSLLSGLAPAPLMLFRHFCAVAFYSIWVMFTHATPVPSSSPKAVGAVPGLDEYPALLVKALRVFWTACIVFGPLLWRYGGRDMQYVRSDAPPDGCTRNSLCAGDMATVIHRRCNGATAFYGSARIWIALGLLVEACAHAEGRERRDAAWLEELADDAVGLGEGALEHADAQGGARGGGVAGGEGVGEGRAGDAGTDDEDVVVIVVHGEQID
ncbi:SE-domain-containing protein [Athelia psychrophila]|uniref:Squalene monooxygenase n=1 Tax=Athelia psychrophila TaxID=1759441 RepID=A0A166HEG8_9AGAM|nr:SE-domain-containing protein [Fibularhizoctonia sp. CBS 109695]